MAFRTICIAFLAVALMLGQEKKPDQIDFSCPMDKDVHQSQPGKCPKCGMRLVAALPDPVEYPVDLTVTPKVLRAGETVRLHFVIRQPAASKLVNRFEVIHEKLFHLFLISRDLQFFAHVHPVQQLDGSFVLETKLPKTGQYRALCDFFPTGGTPQMIVKTIIVPGPDLAQSLSPDLLPKDTENMRVSLRTEPPQPIAGMKTLLFFDLNPGDGLEPYLGAWGHLLAASADLIDLIHTHPAFNEGGPTVQFNMIFPRKGTYRVWVQFQRKGVVNTASFDVPVDELK